MDIDSISADAFGRKERNGSFHFSLGSGPQLNSLALPSVR